jgi:hypothetical protein
MRKFFLLLLVVVSISVSFQAIVLNQARAETTNFEIKVASDYEIQEFLKKFIQSSVDNVKMLVDFVIKLLRDSLGQNGPALPDNKNTFNFLKCHH